jgi:hypothetical protein
VLWWFIGVWLGSAVMIPILWLLSTAHPDLFTAGVELQKQTTPEPPTPAFWRVSSFKVLGYALSGLLAIGAVVLVLIGSSDELHGPTSSLTDAQATPLHERPAPMSAPLSDAKLPMEAVQAESISQEIKAQHEASDVTQSDSYTESAEDNGNHQKDVVTWSVSAVGLPPSKPMIRNERVWKKLRTVRALPRHDIRRSYGTWLWPANQDARG